MSKIRVIYWGSGSVGIPTLEMLATDSNDFELCAIVTREDSPAGRNMQLCCTPIKEYTSKELSDKKLCVEIASHSELNGLKPDCIPLLTPKQVRKNKEFRRILSTINADAFVVISYGHILTNLVLDNAKYSICVHTSALPRMRGPSPVRAALALGLKQSEICTFLMTPHMDDGDIVCRKTIDIPDDMCFPELCRVFSSFSPYLVKESLIGLKNGTISVKPQDHSHATYTRLIKKTDTWIDWNDTADSIRNRARALTPDLCISTTFRNQRIKLDMPLDVKEIEVEQHSPGELINIDRSGELQVACGRNALSVKRLQPESKPWITAKDFFNGFAPKVGEKFVTDDELTKSRSPFESVAPFYDSYKTNNPNKKTD